MEVVMNTKKNVFHGSDIEKIEERYHIPRRDIIAFGSNVNPLGISPGLRRALQEQIDAITTYPDRDYKTLRDCIADYTGTKREQIMAGNGSTELISLAMQTIRPKRACILGPTYSEYEREIGLGGGECFSFPLRPEDGFALNAARLRPVLLEGVDVLVMCNPNNPTSSIIRRTQLNELLTLCAQLHIFVVVDETYIEFTDDPAEASAVSLLADFSNLLILRGVSKFFAAPGLRLGYALCSNNSLLEEMKRRQDPWTINSLAAIAGEQMFRDSDYIARTRALIRAERTRIYRKLSKNPHLHPFVPSANFILVQIVDHSMTAADFFDFAIRRGLMIRDCASFDFLEDYYFRFCFLLPEQNDRLLACIEEAFPSGQAETN